MDAQNKQLLLNANEAVTKGDNEGFLACCTDDVVWEFVGERILRGKEEVREYMEATYVEPPKFMVENLIAADDFVTAIGKISMKDSNGKMIDYSYCDVWRFRNSKMAGLKAFVIETPS